MAIYYSYGDACRGGVRSSPLFYCSHVDVSWTQNSLDELAASWTSGRRWVANQMAVESLGRLDTVLRTLRRAPAVLHFDQQQILGKGSRFSALTAIDEALDALVSALQVMGAATEEGVPPPPRYSPRIADSAGMYAGGHQMWFEMPPPSTSPSPQPEISEILVHHSSGAGGGARKKKKKKHKKPSQGTRPNGGGARYSQSATPSLAAREGMGVGSRGEQSSATVSRLVDAMHWKVLARWEADHADELAMLR